MVPVQDSSGRQPGARGGLCVGTGLSTQLWYCLCPVHTPPGHPLVGILDEHTQPVSQTYSQEEEGRPDGRTRIQTGLSVAGWMPDECGVTW